MTIAVDWDGKNKKKDFVIAIHFEGAIFYYFSDASCECKKYGAWSASVIRNHLIWIYNVLKEGIWECSGSVVECLT